MTIDAVVERVSEGGNLLANLALIDINTWEDSQQVWKAWQNGAPIEGVSTANMGIYRLDNDEVVFDLLGRQGNLFIEDKFRGAAYTGILSNEFFFLPEAMRQHIMAAINNSASVTVHYSKLRVKRDGCSSNYCYVEADGSNTEEEKRLFNGVYGTENPGKGRKVYLLRPNIVKAQLKNKKDELIARACYFYGDRYFNAANRIINCYDSAVRGVRLVKVGEADAPKIDATIDDATREYTSDNVIRFLTENPMVDERLAAACLQAANTFYQAKLQKQ